MSLIILGIFALSIIGIIALLRNKGITRWFFERKLLVWGLIGYGAVLLFSFVIFYAYVNPTLNEHSEEEYKTKKDILKAQKAANTLYSFAYEGNIDKLAEGLYLETEWSFSYNGDQLKVHTPNTHNVSMIITERKETNDGKIEVVNYKSRTIIGDVDFTEKTKVPTVELHENILQVIPPEFVELNLGKFTNEFTTKQFTGENFYDVARVLGRDILYIRVPKDIQLSGDITEMIGEN
ncbi:hypothetical protein ACFYKX_20340 [Cytobacillus sp. FJAT-54145]|uniref:Uncharacterized protein n=1 Tax=Cytobacillus spartinae TaxID=3299023 RepID=A0ABW6KFL6_9BACI